MKIIIVILVIIIILWIIKKSTTNIAKSQLSWDTPVLLGNDIQDGSIFRQIILDDMNKKIANGAIVTKEGKEIPSSFSIAGRNHIYHTASPHYKPGEVYLTTARYGRNMAFVVYIWIDRGFTYDAPYEIKFS
jgi:hypothetical protein